MMRLANWCVCILGFVLVLSGCASNPPRNLMGAYKFADGRLVSVRASKENTLRYRVYQTGESRRLYRHRRHRYFSGPGFVTKSPIDLVVDFKVDESGNAVRLTWRPENRDPETAERVNTHEWVTFPSGDVTLFGRLDLPTVDGPHPAVVLVHGSGDDAATDYFPGGDFFAANGIATLTYDKRGTGRSEGNYAFDFEELAGDVVAAVKWLKSRPEIDPDRIGLCGYSQGGWVAPLAASLTYDVRYVIVNYGMIESPAEEARLETRELMRKRGVDEEALDQVDELTLAAVKVVSTGFKEGWDEFDSIKEKYKDEPWTQELSGTTVHSFVRYPHWIVKLFGPLKTPKRLPWYYDSTDVLDKLSIPMVWILGGKDESAPNELTIPKLRQYEEQGKPYELVIFPNAAHGMLEFHEEEGERIYAGYSKDYFTTQVNRARRFSGMK